MNKPWSFLLMCLLAAASTAGMAADNGAAGSRSFQEQCAALAAGSKNALAAPGRAGWLFLVPELRHLGAGPFWGESAAKAARFAKPDQADPLPAILDFRDQLAAMGIALLVVPVPPKAVIYPDFLFEKIPCDASGCPARLDAALQEFYRRLRSHGVQVLDLTGPFLQERQSPDGPLYCMQDSHWSGAACALAARQIAGEMASVFKNRPRQSFTGEWDTIEITGDLWQALDDPKPPREKLRIRRVRDAATLASAGPARDSPVVLLGDSHNLVFHGGDDMLAREAGLPDQLALELGCPVDLVAVRGSGATPARINLLRRVQKDPHYWAGKKQVIWCFSAREFTESDGWRKVPLNP